MKTNDRRQEERPRTGRRRFPRVEVDGGLPMRDITANTLVEIMNISLGGFQTISSVEPELGEVHTFEANIGAGETLSIRASAVHSEGGGGVARHYTVGWACSEDAVTSRNIATLIGYLTSADSFAHPVPDVKPEPS